MPMELQPELTSILHVKDADKWQCCKKTDDNRWKKITKTVAAHKKWLKQTKYDELLINFPENYHPTFGYRTSCYKNFTAVPKALSSNSSSTEEFGCKQTRSESRSQRGSSFGVYVAKCIFCNCVKQNNLKVVTLNPSAEIKILMAARELHDEDLLLKIGSYVHGSGPDFTDLEVKYHKVCYRTYLNKVRLSSANKSSQLKKTASAVLLKHADRLVIKWNVPILVSSLLKTYKDFFLSYSGDIAVLDGYMVHNMCRKLNKHMDNVITVTSSKKKTGTIV